MVKARALVEEVALSRSIRINTGKYEGQEFFMSIKIKVDAPEDGDLTPQEAAQKAAKAGYAVIDAAIARKITITQRKRGKKATLETVARTYGLELPPKEDF